MKVIADLDDSNYYETRAIELIMEAKSEKVVSEGVAYHTQINKAIQLLALARICES